MKFLIGINKRNNKNKIYLLIGVILIVYLLIIFFYNFYLIDNQNQLFNKLDSLNSINSFSEIEKKLNVNKETSLCILEDKVRTCNKLIYDNLWIFGKYNLIFTEINNNISYKIIKNNKSIFLLFFEYLFLFIFSLFLSYYFLKFYYFFRNKFNPYLKDEYELIRKEWSNIQKSKIELEELLNNGDKSVKEKLRELKDKEKKLEEEYKKLRDKEKREFQEVEDDWMETKEFTFEERKKIYRKLSKYFHPDSGNSFNDEDFINITEAYKNKNDTILFDYYKEYLERIGEEENIYLKQSITESMILVQLVNLGLNPKPQYKISKMHVDFAFPKEKLVVEIDGPYHDDPNQKQRDLKRDLYLNRLGWKVKRYPIREKLTPEKAMKIARKIKRELIRLKK